MTETLHIRMLEEEMERLRLELYQSVNGEPARFGAAEVLPLSMKLDLLIVEMQRAKRQHCQ